MPKKDLEKRREWKRKLEAWKKSGLSGPRWCLTNNEPYPQFRYWKGALIKKEGQKIFQELKEESTHLIPVELRQGNLTLVFPQGVDPRLLERYINTLRGKRC